jgi:hypothetical protein
MTPIILLEQLKAFIERETADLLLPCRADSESAQPKQRPAKIHLMRLPRASEEESAIPYIVLSYLTGSDTQQPNAPPESDCRVRIVAATYSANGEEGALNLLNLLTRIRIPLLRVGKIGEQFLVKSPLEMIVYPDNTEPYYLGEMMTNWVLPPIETEVNYYGS